MSSLQSTHALWSVLAFVAIVAARVAVWIVAARERVQRARIERSKYSSRWRSNFAADDRKRTAPPVRES